MTTDATNIPRTVTEDHMYELTLVPVEVFGAENGYGLMDAVSSWSDCNRARGHIFRVDDCDPQYRRPQDVIKIYVPASEIEKLTGTDWQEAGDDVD